VARFQHGRWTVGAKAGLARLLLNERRLPKTKFRTARGEVMSIEKKSLISTLKTAKKANVASGPAATNEGSVTRKSQVKKAAVYKKTSVKKMAFNKMS
jgi:hypothetical protein